MTEFEVVNKEVATIYADCWMEDYYRGREIKQSFAKSSHYLPKEEAISLIRRYVKGLNSFQPYLMNKLPDDSLVRIAREGDVCIYVKSKLLEEFIEENKTSKEYMMDRFGCDEFDHINDEYRIRWY